ncbi:MAG: DUF2163 domain-containing protein [Pseudomonadota bacterium]
MREFSEDLRQRLASGVTTTCLCWRLERSDGETVGLTEHDRQLFVNGEDYLPGGVGMAGPLSQSNGLKPGQASGAGALSSDAITEADLGASLWDGARVDVLRVDWERPDLFWTVWTGRLSEIVHGDLGFEAGLVSTKADLERPVGRVYSRHCDAVLGDALCGVDLQALGDENAHCDGRWETCRSVFQNTDNYRGFPTMPGNDLLLAGPAATGNTGGAR